MTVEEQQKFLKVIQTERVRYKEQMLISMFTGMRMVEVNALTPKDINFKFNFINIDWIACILIQSQKRQCVCK